MFIALQHPNLCAPAERHVLCRLQLHSAPHGAGYVRTWSYKHFAPPEQDPQYQHNDFSGKQLGHLNWLCPKSLSSKFLACEAGVSIKPGAQAPGHNQRSG